MLSEDRGEAVLYPDRPQAVPETLGPKERTYDPSIWSQSYSCLSNLLATQKTPDNLLLYLREILQFKSVSTFLFLKQQEKSFVCGTQSDPNTPLAFQLQSCVT